MMAGAEEEAIFRVVDKAQEIIIKEQLEKDLRERAGPILTPFIRTSMMRIPTGLPPMRMAIKDGTGRTPISGWLARSDHITSSS